MWCRSVLAFVVSLALVTPAAALGVYVDASAGSDVTGDGTATNPWRTLTHALGSGLVEGDEVLVSAGIYDAALGEVFPIDVPQGVSVRGSAAGETLVRAPAAPPWPAALLRAAVGTAVLPSLSVIENLVLEGPGAATASTGILLVAGKGQGPVVSDCRIYGFGRALAAGLAVVAGPEQRLDSRPFVDGNLLHDNGIAVSISVSVSATPGRVRERTEIQNNFIRDNGTAIAIHAACSGCDASGVDVGNAILNNTIAGNAGDALVLTNTDCTLAFATNSPQVQNNIIAFNGGYALAVDACSEPNTIDTNAFWANTLGGEGPAATNLIADPLLVDVAGGDLHLSPGSPCVDTGLAFDDVADDWDGDLRPVDGDGDGTAAYDIGADEYRVVSTFSLRRANFLSLVPLLPDKAAVIPMFPANPFTTLVTTSLASGDSDVPGVLSDERIPLAFYQHDGPESSRLRCVKVLVEDSVRFDLR